MSGVMAELRFKVDDGYLEKVAAALGTNSNAEIMKSALMLIYWAAEERKKGRYILSAEADGTRAERVIIPQLEYVAAMSSKPAAPAPSKDSKSRTNS